MGKNFSDHVPCNPDVYCNLRETIGCFEDIHHEAYPKSQYRTTLEKEFREHVMNKVLMCRMIHNEEHAQWLIPRKAEPSEMRNLMEVYDAEKKSSTEGRTG